MAISHDAVSQRRFVLMLLGFFFCFVASGAVLKANILPEDAPVLISEKDSTRAFAGKPTKRGVDTSVGVFQPGSNTRITLFVANLDLLEGEGANAFRADMEDSLNRRYPLTIVSLERTERGGVYALTVQLHGAIGDVGDVLTRVTWRGMSSNRVRVAIGHAGDGLKDDADAVPTPMPEKPIKRVETEASSNETLADRIRFMEQAAFGPNPATELRLRQLGFSRWLDEQTAQKINASNVSRFSTFPYPNVVPRQTEPAQGCIGIPLAECQREHYSMYPLQNWFYKEALYGEDQQLRRRTSWALSQIWVVSGRDIVQSGRMLPYIKILDRYAFGNYRKLMEEMTLNPAMGQYLDMAISTRQSPNENYAREILQLFTIGVDSLNPDGTPKLDQNGNRIPAYTQEDINNFTKVFTGWVNCQQGPPACPNNTVASIPNYIDPMIVIAGNHDLSAKTLFNYPNAQNTIISACTGCTGTAINAYADDSLDKTLDNIYNHPNVAPFVSKLLIQQLVTSNPTPAFVGRVAAVFNANRTSERQLAEVVKAILLDPEARGSVKTDPDYGKLREPVLYLTNLIRPFNPRAQSNAVTTANCNNLSDGVLNGITLLLDQDVFNPPTVFNYYPLDGTVPNTNLAGGEFGIFSTGTALKRQNVVNQFVFPSGQNVLGVPMSNNPTASPNLPTHAPCGTSIVYSRLTPFAQDDPTGGLLVEQLNREMLHGTMSPQVRNHILQAIQEVGSTNFDKRVRTAIYLVATSSQFQVQR